MDIPNCFYRVSVKGLILNESKDKFLVCKEDSGYWELPGGGLDWGESCEEGLRREVREEMGLDVIQVSKQPSYFFTGEQTMKPGVQIANVVYECSVATLDITPSEECVEIMFVNAEKAKSLKAFDEVLSLAEVFDSKNQA